MSVDLQGRSSIILPGLSRSHKSTGPYPCTVGSSLASYRLTSYLLYIVLTCFFQKGGCDLVCRVSKNRICREISPGSSAISISRARVCCVPVYSQHKSKAKYGWAALLMWWHTFRFPIPWMNEDELVLLSK